MLKFFEIFQFKQPRQNKEIDRIDNSVLHMSPIADECRLFNRKKGYSLTIKLYESAVRENGKNSQTLMRDIFSQL